MFNMIHKQAALAVEELLDIARLKPGTILVVGCFSSEVVGEQIGKGSSLEAAQAIFDGMFPVLKKRGVFLAAQCCEHLNRAIIIERAALSANAPLCWVMPQPKAGGSFATVAWQNFTDPAAVEEIRADAGIDIGGTLIGMHLKKVAVPVRLSITKIGEAPILCARTRPKLIGGNRAIYPEEM